LEGIDVEWRFLPWERAYENAKNSNDWDASCCWRPSEETKLAFLMSDTITETSFVFYHLKSYKFHWSSLKRLEGIKIGGTSKYHYGEAFMDAIEAKKLSIEYTTKDEFNYRKLLAGRIQILPNDPYVGNAQIRNNLSPEQASLLTYSPKKFSESTLHLIMSKSNKRNKRNKHFIDKFNTGLKRLKASGRYQQMLKDLEVGKYDNKN
jgi:polar amino acid transport system substrate-binding protein